MPSPETETIFYTGDIVEGPGIYSGNTIRGQFTGKFRNMPNGCSAVEIMWDGAAVPQWIFCPIKLIERK